MPDTYNDAIKTCAAEAGKVLETASSTLKVEKDGVLKIAFGNVTTDTRLSTKDILAKDIAFEEYQRCMKARGFAR